MRVLFSPQRDDRQLAYQFDGEIIIATLDGQSDTFDFSTLPEGEVPKKDNGEPDIDTFLTIVPIRGGRRRSDGVLELILLYFHGKNATQEELYPDWQEVG